jgi:hypothetical protein
MLRIETGQGWYIASPSASRENGRRQGDLYP